MAGFFLLFSCNKEDNFNESQNNEVTVSKTINFKGLKVNNKFSFTEEELITPKEEGLLTILREAHDDYYKKSGLSHKFSGALDEERLVKATRDVLPYFPYQENGVNEKMIQKDFPEITAENFEENADVIDDYYNSSLNRVVANKYYNDSFIPVPIDGEDNPDDYTANPPKLPYFKSEREVGEETFECFDREMDLKFLDVRRKTVIATADNDTRIAHKKYYPNTDEDKTKRDAFKHIIWNALLCKYFWTVSSKNKKVAFARDVTNLWEACGDNGYGTRQMDYHNNNIGREIYKQESKYKKNFLGWTTGIKNPTDARLESVIHNEVEINIFINLAGYAGNRNKQENQAYFEIIKKKGSKNQFT